MSGEQAVLRTTLLHGLVEAARVNVDAGNEGIRLFELARVYLPTGEQLPEERWRVGGIAEGGFEAAAGGRRGALRGVPPPARRAPRVARPPPSGQGGRDRRGLARRAASDAPRRAWGAFELDVEALMAPLPERILYDDVITYPANRQDIAIAVAEDVEAAAIVAAAREAAGPSFARRASSTSTAASRSATGGSRSRCTSSSSRPSGRSPTTRSPCSATGSSPRSASASARSCAA